MAITGFNINDFKSNFEGGARAYLFMYKPNLPVTTVDSKYLVRASTFPETTVEEILVQWQGIDYKLAGKQTFTDFTITFNVDLKAAIRDDFEEWTKMIHNVPGDHKYGKPSDYSRNQDLVLLDYEGNEMMNVKLVDAWPKSVAAITLDYSSMDVMQFDVTFAYLYHEIEKLG